MLKGHKEARIYNIAHFVTKAHMFIMVQLLYIYPISHEIQKQQDAGEYFYLQL